MYFKWKELSDLHINTFQSIARREFPQVGGLHNTLVLHQMSLDMNNLYKLYISRKGPIGPLCS